MANKQLIGDAAGLKEGGKGLRFDVKSKTGEVAPAFVISFDAQFFAYLNKCGHIAVQLDYMPGEFFGDDGQTLICATHGAEYAPDTGACLGGPCYGVGLEALRISEQSGQLYLDEDDFEVLVNNSDSQSGEK